MPLGWGEADEWTPVEQGKDLASRNPGAGHLVQEDAPTLPTATLADFLA